MRIALTVMLLVSVGLSAEANSSGWKSADDAPLRSATKVTSRPTIQVSSHTTLVPRRHTVYQANTAAANSGFNTQQLQQGFQAADQWVQTAAAQPQTTIGGEIYNGVDNLAKGTTEVLQNAGEAIQGTGQNLAQTVERALGLNQPVQPPAPAGSGRYNQWSYNYPNQQQPAVAPTATASQWATPQSQWPAATTATNAQQPTYQPTATQTTSGQISNQGTNTGWGGTQPVATSTTTTSGQISNQGTNTGWGGTQPVATSTTSANGWNTPPPSQTPAMPAAQSQPQGGLTAPNFNDSRSAANDSSVLVPRGGATQPVPPTLGTASGGALPDTRNGWPPSTPSSTSWSNNSQPSTANTSPPSETPWWQDPQWNSNASNNSKPNVQPMNAGYGDRPAPGSETWNTSVPPAIGTPPSMSPTPGSQQVVGSPLADSKARTAWLLLIPSFALNVYVWWSYLEIRSKYLGSLRRGGAAYTA